MNRQPNRETLHQYEALDNSLQNIHTVLSVCELEQREVITQRVLDLVLTVQGIKESIIEDSFSVLSSPSTDPIMDISHEPRDVSIPSLWPTVHVCLPSPKAETDTSLASPETETDTSLPSQKVATRTSPPSPANRNSSLCQSLDSDLELSVSSPPSTSKGDHATLVNTAPLTRVSNHMASTSTPLTSTTGILPFFKLAGQKIASLNQRSSPCKNTCTYHAQRQKGLKFQLTHENRTDNPTDNNAKQIPMNERVTLPPRQTTDEVTMQTSPPPPSILTCKPFLCASSYTPNKAPVTEISQETSVKRSALKSKYPSSPHGSSTHQSQTFLAWKTSFLKHLPKPKMLKTVKPFQLTPNTRTDSWRKLSETQPGPVQKVIKSNEKTVPQVKDMDRLSSRSIEEFSNRRNTSSLQPWRSSSKSKSLLQPFMASPLSQSPPALCSIILSSVVAHPGSCRDPESIRERTKNANILMMNESEEGENSFRSEFWDHRTAMPESHNEDIVTDAREGNTKPYVLPATLNLPQSEHLVSHASPTFESAKRKLFYNENKNVPLKKRFNPNFNETSKDDSPYKSSVFQEKPGTPNEKQITPKQNSIANGKSYTPKTKPRVKGKPHPPKTKPRAHGKQQVTPHRRSSRERKSYNEETSRTSRARQPMQSASMEEELVQQLEEILTAFMAGRKQATTKMLPPDKQNQLIEFASLCYISAVKTTGGVRLRKTSASRAPISLDREWMLA